MKSSWINFLLCLAMVVSFCSSCQSSQSTKKEWYEDNGKIKILATTAMVADLVQAVVGDRADVAILIGVGQDPHSYQLVKGDNEKIQTADIIFYSGLDLEHGPSLKDRLIHSDNAYGLGQYLLEVHPELILTAEGSYDPHIWMDIDLFSQSLDFIASTISSIDPEGFQDYKNNAQQKYSKLQDLHQEIITLLHKLPDNSRYLVTSHDAFNYFTRAYLATESEKISGDWRKRFEAPEGLAPDSQLSTYDIQFIIDHLQFYDVHVIFPESNVSKKSILKIEEAAEQMGHQIQISEVALYGDSMGEEGSAGDTYEKMIWHNAQAIYKEIGESIHANM